MVIRNNLKIGIVTRAYSGRVVLYYQMIKR